MSLITLKNIGKIYVSDNNVSVGIRGVNLSFDRGEFVSITGKSGSGKSTLLNVISGMDSYEEGEMYVVGKPTSHYTQLDWETYRRKYISFVFQEYNIVDSFTVLENVELALMDIKDVVARRKKAIELIEKVGLKDFVKQKGSKLSGGQKQRTVIARALAKDAPIILADEPTGNLDSESAKEITELLHQISKDKLVIVVTHNFEQFEAISTRHIRIFDGAIESDQVLVETEKLEDVKVVDKKVNEIRNGIHLGAVIYKSKPKLSIFISSLLILASIAIFFVSTIFSGSLDVFKKVTMFNEIDGRVVLVKQNGSVITDNELKSLQTELGYDTYIHYDSLLDDSATWSTDDGTFELEFTYTYNETFGNKIIGSYPTKVNEVFLYLPITARPYFGTSVSDNKIIFNNMTFYIVGMKYYYDTNKTAKALFSEDGFKAMTLIDYLALDKNYSNTETSIILLINGSDDDPYQATFTSIEVTDKIGSNNIYVNCKEISTFINDKKASNASYTYSYSLYIHSESQTYNYDSYEYETTFTYDKTFDSSYFVSDGSSIDSSILTNHDNTLFIGTGLVYLLSDEILSNTYTQASIFFKDNKEASKYIDTLNEKGYVAVMSNTTYEDSDSVTAMLESLLSVFYILIWLVSIVFLAFFTNLCTSRSIESFRPDVAIMRSMGINVKTIKIGVYARMFIALIPSYILLIVAPIVIFRTPILSKNFTYLYAWEYIIIALGMLILVYRITKKQIKKIFDVSVKKSLRGGANND